MKKELIDIWKYIVGLRDFGIVLGWQDRFVFPLDLEWYLKRSSKYFSPFYGDGIPMHNYKSVGLQYNPTRISGYALAHWNRFVDRAYEQSLDKFLRNANWLVRSAKRRGEALVWEHGFDWKDLRKPWISGMAQGQAISVLARAYYQTNSRDYIDVAVQATGAFMKDIEHGGVRTYLHGKYLFFEEYPSYNPTHVLNGYLYAVIGLINLVRVCGSDSSLETIIECCRETLENCCADWYLGYWSTYDLHNTNGVRNATTTSYHLVHIALFQFLAEYFSCDVLTQMATHWMKCFDRSLCRLLAAKEKIRY